MNNPSWGNLPIYANILGVESVHMQWTIMSSMRIRIRRIYPLAWAVRFPLAERKYYIVGLHHKPFYTEDNLPCHPNHSLSLFVQLPH